MTRTAGAPLTVTCIADHSAIGALVKETIATLLPGAVVDITGTALVRGVPEADCVVVDDRVNHESGLEVLRSLRARGFGGGAVLLVDAPSAAVQSEAAALGAAACVPKAELVQALPMAVVAALRLAGAGDLDAAAGTLRRGQQLVAAGEIALRLQHSLNNPLAALLAEAQLLELEALPEEHHRSVVRIVELCRRVIGEVKKLDGISG